MKRIAIYFAFLVACTSCKTPPDRNCIDFKTGIFEFSMPVDGEVVTSTFERTEAIEVDYFKGKQDSSTVKWINDCEYILKRINPKNRAEEKPIHIKILTTKGNSYSFEFSTVGDSKKLRGTAIKTK